MRISTCFIVTSVVLSFVPSAPAVAAPTGTQTCKKMIADGRGGGLTQEECLCRYRIADVVLDADVKALMFDSWSNGTNNMKAIEALPGPGRVKKQLKTMKRTIGKNCSLS